MAKFLGLTAVGWHSMLKNWWEKLLASLLLSAIVVGSAFLLFLICRRIVRAWWKRHKILKVPAEVTKYLADLQRNDNQQIRLQRAPKRRPKTFGVFLGSLSSSPKTSQIELLSKWDLIVLDPFKQGVLDIVSSHCTSPHIIGRLNVSEVVERYGSRKGRTILRSFKSIAQTLETSFLPFTGILLADWQTHFQPVLLNELIRFINNIGFVVYLELSPPNYLSEDECLEINLELIKGIIFRNATILPNGDRCNYFQMENMRRSQRALARQTSANGATVMVWETTDDNVEVNPAVISRTYKWCRFNNAISWIGSKTALVNVESAASRTIAGEPLGALMLLKDERIVKLQETWKLNDCISSKPSGSETIYDSLDSFVPGLTKKLSTFPTYQSSNPNTEAVDTHDFIWKPQELQEENPLSFSPHGTDYTTLGCFQLGLECSPDDFIDLVEQQRRLAELEFLQIVDIQELRRLASQLLPLCDTFRSHASTLLVAQAIKELHVLITSSTGGPNDRLKVYTGLHSGFRTNPTAQFWGLYDVDGTGGVEIFISSKTRDLHGTILHTFLSSRNCERVQCFVAELLLAQQTNNLEDKWELPRRVVQDIEQCSPTEVITFMRQLAFSKYAEWNDDCSVLASRLQAICEYQLIDVPSHTQRRALNSATYLHGKVSPDDLVSHRLAWYREQGCHSLDLSTAIALFKEIELRFKEVLLNRHVKTLSQIEWVLQEVLRPEKIDARADFFALCVFCACRGLAIEEVYLEILDRNPMPNPAPDQAACYAEMFATGSRCDAYFDTTPNVLGRILSDKIYAYYRANQPPMRDDEVTELPTTYASKLVDLDPDAGPEKLPMYYQVTFIGMFAIPALIDILLLTTIGRGLYLSTFMTSEEKSMATNALMTSLFVTGAIGTWIGSGGAYYLHSMAFPVMNMFVLTRFIAGVAVCLTAGTFAMVIIAIVKGIYAGVIFLLYFIFLTTYLTMLATLAIYQLPGFMFQSGRLVIITCIPILFISPILTLWIGHDIAVYLCVILIFLVALILGARKVIANWGNWYLKIVCITDREVVDWYSTSTGTKAFVDSDSASTDAEVDVTATSQPRKALQDAVFRERNKKFWDKPTADAFVKKLADGYLATNFLMIWYCKYTRTKMPTPYSPTWNLQTAAGIDTVREMQKGLKLHNAFVHWRYGGDEVWCGILYFVVALMDKWVALLTGASIVGLSAADSETYRLAVGFGLASYLVSAIFLDATVTPLWATANKNAPRPIGSLEALRDVKIADAQARRHLYWSKFIKFICSHAYGVAITSALMWSFEESRDAVIMYMAYMIAYTGLLWYQYNRVYTGSLALKDLLIGAAVGLLTGPIFHQFDSEFSYINVIALGASTWTVAILSLRTAKIGWPRFRRYQRLPGEAEESISYSSSGLGPVPEYTQTVLAEIYESVSALPSESRYRLDPLHHPGVEVMENLKAQTTRDRSYMLQDAFRSANYLVRRTSELWQKGEIVVDLVPAPYLLRPGKNMRSISRTVDNQLHVMVFIGLNMTGNNWTLDIRRNCKVIAEALIQATTESKLGMSHEHSMLTELLVADQNEDESLPIPEGVKRQLEISKNDRTKVLRNEAKELLYFLLLGLDCDTNWDVLPENMRYFFLKRCLGDACQVTGEQSAWIQSKFCEGNALDVYQHIARCNLGATFTSTLGSYTAALEAEHLFGEDLVGPNSYEAFAPFPLGGDDLEKQPFLAQAGNSGKVLLGKMKNPVKRLAYIIKVSLKFLVVTLVADPEFQRELDYTMSEQPRFVRTSVTWILNGIWLFCKTLQGIILPYFLFHGREEVFKVYNAMRGVRTIIKKKRVVIESLDGTSTCFVKSNADGSTTLRQYLGDYQEEPTGSENLTAINTYSDKLVLREREVYSRDNLVNIFTYEYPQDSKGRKSRLPLQRQSAGGKHRIEVVQYDEKGYITSGSFVKDDNMVHFRWYYRKDAKFDDELLRAEYDLLHIQIKVSWCVRPPKRSEKWNRWIPNPKVTEATFIEGENTYYSQWTYDHKFLPHIWTSCNGLPVPTPPMIQYDWYGVLSKPNTCTFLSDDPLFSFNSARKSFVSRMLGFNVKRHEISTSVARSHLWKSWKDSKGFDAVTARWLDEYALRSDQILRPYWVARDRGQLKVAGKYLDAQADTIIAQTDVDPEISSWTLLAYKLSDLYSFGQGGDSTINTRTESTQIRDNDETLHVLAMDTGTWPNEGGGVSACRRDMVNNLKSIRWHVVAENANDFGLPKFQVEKNIQSLTILPLWGLDFLTPTHGVFRNHLDSAVQQRSAYTSKDDIKQNFLPILETLVRCARAINLTQQHLDDSLKALIDLNAYFQSSHHWSDVWLSDTVKDKWRELWLCEGMENARPISEWLEAERPTLAHLDQALDMWHRFLFIFSIPVPDKIPDVFQASHHFAGASYGVLCKALRNCTLHVWDHCISWREVTVFLSSAMSFDPPFVCTSLINLSRVTATLTLTHADVVLPCCDYFNPGWEEELGTIEGTIAHRRAFARKIDPVVNGIANMERFKPVEKVKSQKPTVSMLSHVRFVKDIKNAILAADIIVNDWGFEDYSLEIYGDMIKAPAYSVECQEIIAGKSLGKNVLLKGLGRPEKVMEDAWLFLNCSVSEGLPLAMGEAALTGVPIVCTDVGASFRVVTDPKTGSKFSSVVAPNDSLSLARAQINVLALLDEWSAYAGDEKTDQVPKLSLQPTREEVKQITQRMYDKTEQRRALGMRGRQNVFDSFSSDRYLREHEQMLWIGKLRSKSYHVRKSMAPSIFSSQFDAKSSRMSMYSRNSRYSRQSSRFDTRSTRASSPRSHSRLLFPNESRMSLLRHSS